jgi:hypothetical protein
MTLTAHQPITPEALTAAFRASRLKFTKGYGLVAAMQIPVVAWALERHALAIQKAKQQQHGTPAPTQQVTQGEQHA